jgi:importin-5
MLPLIGQLVINTVGNNSDWRYKHAGIMAFSQVGEYVDDPEKIRSMVPIIVEHCNHTNPKIRYASLHAIG